jgi:hypothetical protein
MPGLTRWYLRAAMLHLGGALVLGLLLQLHRPAPALARIKAFTTR